MLQSSSGPLDARADDVKARCDVIAAGSITFAFALLYGRLAVAAVPRTYW